MKTCLVIALSLAVICGVVTADNVLNNIWNTAKAVGCLATVTPKLTQDCGRAFEEELNSRPRGENDKKSDCCAFLRYQSCVEKIAEKECGDEGEAVAKKFINDFNRRVTSDDCIDYGFITCITMTQMAIAGAVVLALLALLSCICCCCCRR